MRIQLGRLWGTAKGILRGNIITVEIILKTKLTSYKQLNGEFQASRQTKSQAQTLQFARNNKNYERSDEIQNEKNTIKINKARTWFFENLNKICKRLAQLTNRKMNMTQIKKLKIKSCPSNCNIAPQWRKPPERGMTQLGRPMMQKKLPEK